MRKVLVSLTTVAVMLALVVAVQAGTLTKSANSWYYNSDEAGTVWVKDNKKTFEYDVEAGLKTRVRRVREAGGTVYGEGFQQVFHRDPVEVKARESRIGVIQELGTGTLAQQTAIIGTDLQKLSEEGREDTEEFRLLQQQYKDYREALQRLEEESRTDLSLMQMMVEAKKAYIENLEAQADEATMAGDVSGAIDLRKQAQGQRDELKDVQEGVGRDLEKAYADILGNIKAEGLEGVIKTENLIPPDYSSALKDIINNIGVLSTALQGLTQRVGESREEFEARRNKAVQDLAAERGRAERLVSQVQGKPAQEALIESATDPGQTAARQGVRETLEREQRKRVEQERTRIQESGAFGGQWKQWGKRMLGVDQPTDTMSDTLKEQLRGLDPMSRRQFLEQRAADVPVYFSRGHFLVFR